MIVHLSIAVLFAGLGSYVSFFKPEYLTSNIDSKPSNLWQWVATISSFFFCIAAVLVLSPQSVLDWVNILFLLVFFFIAFIDLYSKIIPNTLVILLLLVVIPKLYLEFKLELVLSALILFTVFALLNVAMQKFYSKRAFGWGDVKLITVLALYSGWDILWVVYLGIILGGVIAGVGLLTKKITKETHIPMAVFLFLAYILVPLIDPGKWF